MPQLAQLHAVAGIFLQDAHASCAHEKLHRSKCTLRQSVAIALLKNILYLSNGIFSGINKANILSTGLKPVAEVQLFVIDSSVVLQKRRQLPLQNRR
jgi:hypothetical protein